MTYADIRGKAYDHRRTNVFRILWKDLKVHVPREDDYEYCICCQGRGMAFYLEDVCRDVVAFWAFIIVFPGFILSKLFQILFPYVIIGFLIYLSEWNKIDKFQLVMLFTYILLQLILFILTVMIWKIHHWLWHIQCGVTNIYWNRSEDIDLIANFKEWYFAKASLPIVEKYILELYGPDIGKIIMGYVSSIDTDDASIDRQNKTNEQATKNGVSLTVGLVQIKDL